MIANILYAFHMRNDNDIYLIMIPLIILSQI